MQSSYRIFTIFGISVELHFTFILFLVLLTLLQGLQAFILWVILFSIVLIHELFHSLTAKRFGIAVPRITLTPIGGLANIELPEDPKKEFLISFAGPFSNFLMMFLIIPVALYIGMPLGDLLGLSVQQGIEKINIFDLPYLLSELFWINLVLGAFNLLPGFPMDGGRVFRAILAFRLDYIRATEIAVHVGRIISLLILIWGLFANPFAIIIGLFLLLAGSQELSVLKIRHSFAGMKMRNLAVHNVRYVHEAATLRDFMELVASRDQDHYPVVDSSGKVMGVLRMADLERIDSKDMDRLLVRDVAGKEIDVVDANTEVEKALGTLLSKDFVLLVDAGRIIGYITPGHLMEASKFYGIVNRG